MTPDPRTIIEARLRALIEQWNADAEAIEEADEPKVPKVRRGLAAEAIRACARSLEAALASPPPAPPTESTQVDESGSSEPSGLDGAVLELCPVCGGSRRVTLRDDWQRGVELGQAVPIVGCGNPWHYIGSGDHTRHVNAARGEHCQRATEASKDCECRVKLT